MPKKKAVEIPLASELISVREVAEKYGLDLKAVYKLIYDGNLPAYRVGPRSLRVLPSEAQKFFAGYEHVKPFEPKGAKK